MCIKWMLNYANGSMDGVFTRDDLCFRGRLSLHF